MSNHETYRSVGVWIDHREAVLVSLKDEETMVERIVSNAESHYRPKGGWRASGTYVAQAVSKEVTAEERRLHQYHHFYQEIIANVGRPVNLYIFGPGEAKLELKKEIEKIKELPVKIVAVDASDKLTQNQIVAKVKSVFEAA